VIAYHYVNKTLRDGRPVPADGVWLEHEGVIELCASGLHASRTPWQALQYAPGPTLCEVECEGDIVEEGDKFVCRRRKIIRRVDLEKPMRDLARAEALRVIHLWECPAIVKQYLETGDDSIRDAAWDAAWDAAMAAARDAARAAARDAARAAARDAAWDAARDAARAAARASARASARAEFAVMVNGAFTDYL